MAITPKEACRNHGTKDCMGCDIIRHCKHINERYNELSKEWKVLNRIAEFGIPTIETARELKRVEDEQMAILEIFD